MCENGTLDANTKISHEGFMMKLARVIIIHHFLNGSNLSFDRNMGCILHKITLEYSTLERNMQCVETAFSEKIQEY